MNTSRIACGLGVASLWLCASQVSASITFDVRLISVDGVATADPHNYVVQPGDIGKIGKVEVYAVVAGTNGTTTDEGFQSAAGSFTTPGSSVRAGLSNQLIADANFAASGSSGGTAQDVDGDSDIDIGFKAGDATTAYFNARAASMQPGTSFKIATFDMTFGSIDPNGTPTMLTFVPRPGGTNGLWREDGFSKSYTSPVTVAPVNLFVPEPASVATLALTATALLGRRRR